MFGHAKHQIGKLRKCILGPCLDIIKSSDIQLFYQGFEFDAGYRDSVRRRIDEL